MIEEYEEHSSNSKQPIDILTANLTIPLNILTTLIINLTIPMTILPTILTILTTIVIIQDHTRFYRAAQFCQDEKIAKCESLCHFVTLSLTLSVIFQIFDLLTQLKTKDTLLSLGTNLQVPPGYIGYHV